jgi:hypothetical protein
LKWVLNTQDGLGGLGCINLVKDRTKWQAVVNTVMNIQVPQSMGNLLTMRGMLVSQGGRCHVAFIILVYVCHITEIP